MLLSILSLALSLSLLVLLVQNHRAGVRHQKIMQQHFDAVKKEIDEIRGFLNF